MPLPRPRSSFPRQASARRRQWKWDQAKLNQIYLNATLGICTIAGVCHGRNVWEVGEGRPEVVYGDDALVKAYTDCCGYNPHAKPVLDPETGEMANPTDRGCNELRVLKYMRKTGILGPDGKPFTIKSFHGIHPEHEQNWACADWLLGGTYLGIVIPAFMEEWMQQPVMPDWVWPKKLTPAALKPEGGHAIWKIAYNLNADDNDAEGAEVSTWGMKVRASRLFLRNLTDEVWGVLGWDSVPNVLHFDMKTLEQDLHALAA